MASRKAAASGLARLVAAAVGSCKRRGRLESTRRAFSWQPAKVDYAQPGSGLMSGHSAWTYHQPASQQHILPRALQELQHQPILFSSTKEQDSVADSKQEWDMDIAETRKIVMHVNAVALKKRLKSDPRDSFGYEDLLALIMESGVAATRDEARCYSRALDEAGVVLIFRENVYLHPERVAKLVARALPFAVVPPNDPRRAELMKLEEIKSHIDGIAHRQVRRLLWTGLLGLTGQALLFFRLTFWELSWDVMEPIAFFVTTSGLIAGYTYFLITARDPSYQDFMQRLFLSKQMKLFKKNNFDYLRYQLLRRQCQCLDPDERRW